MTFSATVRSRSSCDRAVDDAHPAAPGEALDAVVDEDVTWGELRHAVQTLPVPAQPFARGRRLRSMRNPMLLCSSPLTVAAGALPAGDRRRASGWTPTQSFAVGKDSRARPARRDRRRRHERARVLLEVGQAHALDRAPESAASARRARSSDGRERLVGRRPRRAGASCRLGGHRRDPRRGADARRRRDRRAARRDEQRRGDQRRAGRRRPARRLGGRRAPVPQDEGSPVLRRAR